MRIFNLLSVHSTAALLVMVAVALVACGPGASDKELVESAKSYLAVKQVREATIELKNALQANPQNAEARFLLGEINMQIGNLASAEKEYQRAIEIGLNPEASLIGKIRAMIAQRKYKEVLELPNAANDWSDTSQANILALKAIAQIGEDDLVKAKGTYLSAKALDKNAYEVLKVAVLLQLADNRITDAEQAISKAQKLFPGNSELMLMRANLAALNKQNEEAIHIFEQVIKLGPDKIMSLNARRAHLGILKLSVLEKDFNRVQKSRDAFAENNISDPEVNYYLALAAFEEKNFDRAEIYLQKILQISTTHGPTLLLSGSVSYAKRDFEKAAYFLSRYVANYPDNNQARKLLGRAYLALGQNDDALSEFNAVLNENADDAELIALVGLSKISSGQIQLGITGLEKALKMMPDDSSLKLQLAKAYIADGQTDKAIKQLDEILQAHGNNDQIKTIKVLAYLQSQDIEMAMNTARQMLAKSPDRPDVLSLMGSIQLAASNTAAARKYFNQALRINADHIGAEMNLARLDEQQGDPVSAEKRYLSILEKEPESVSVMTSLARLAAQQGNTESQVKWLEAARRTDKKELLSRVALAEVYLKQGNMSDSEILLRELEEVHSNALVVLAVKSKLLMAQKRFNQADTIISEIINARPELDIGYYLMAQNQLALGNNKAALENLRKSYSLKPGALRNAILLASVEQKTGNYKRPLALGEEIITTAPDSAVGYVIKGDAVLAMQKSQQALENFNKAWAITKSRDIALRRFNVTRRLSGLTEAAPILTSWLEGQSDDDSVLLELATAYFIDNQHDKAALYFEKVLVLQPDNIVALNNLAWLYGLENNPRGLVLARKAYALQPESPSILDTYGWLLLKNNKTSEALTLLKQAADKLPEVPEVQYHYAKALFRTGAISAANTILKPLVESGKTFDGRIDAEKMLAQ